MKVSLQAVCKTYPGPAEGPPVNVLDAVTLEAPSGASLAIVGPSGSGKSTLLNLVGALDRPTSGVVALDGREIQALPERERTRLRGREIGFIFQLHHLLPPCSVLENVLVPTLSGQVPRPDRAVVERARALLDRVGLGGRMEHRPAELSGGEQLRTAVVRALVNRPRLLLADEPTGSLDHRGARALVELLVELNREEGVTLLMVTHSAELAAMLNRTLRLEDGRLVEPGRQV